MNIKSIIEVDLQPHETAKSIRAELSEYCGILFECDNTKEDAIAFHNGRRIAALGFDDRANARAYQTMRMSRRS